MGALYRRVRPATFEDLIGQTHVKEVLKGALAQDRLAHAYLFSGPRGVGKTTSARLIAMAVNCEAPVEKRPCGKCTSCILVRQGHHPDVLEIDAASHNSVEDVRELRERILLAPLQGRYKVFILDEAHMMSKSAFNALLKTLEEPPAHVIFVFATTEPERMPLTILSRTQHFRFRRLLEEEIAGKLAEIAKNEGVEVDPEALQLLANLADGAMRDGESLLERLLSLGQNPLTFENARAALGLPPRERLWQIVEALDRGQVGVAIKNATQLFQEGFSARTLNEGVAEALQKGLHAQLGLGEGPSLRANSARVIAALTALDEHADRLARRDDAFALELGLLKLHHELQREDRSESARPQTDAQTASIQARMQAPPPETPARHRQSPSGAELAPAAQGTQISSVESTWKAILSQMPQAVRAFLREAKPQTGDQSLVLIFPSTHQFHYDNALRNQEQVARAVREQMNLGLELRLGDKQATVEYPAAQPEPRTDTPLLPQASESSAAARPDSDEYQEDAAGPRLDNEAAPQGPTMLQHPEFKRLLHSFRAHLKEFVPLEPNVPDPPIPLKADEDPSES